MIRVLPPEIANRIAAGEVIERPASVVKELVENALDAGARRIRVEIEGGGSRRISVTDDGGGMDSADLGRCLLPHATSKIAAVEDLHRIGTFGFRGEALASIASVSRTIVTTRKAGSDLGARIVSDGGATGTVEPAGAPLGTTVEVHNLFFNVPARRSFLKQDRFELAQIVEILTRLALPDPDWTLELVSEGKAVLVAEAGSDEHRLESLFGTEIAGRLLPIRGERGSSRLRGFVGPVDLVKPSARFQQLLVNGRAIKDRKLSFAIVEAYRGLIMPKDHPVAFLYLNVDPAMVDVNVHPAKTEVRFRDPDALFGLILRAIRERLAAAPGAELRTVYATAAGGAPAVAREAQPFVWVDVARELGFGADEPRPEPRAAPTKPEAPPKPASFVPTPRFLQAHRSYVVAETDEGIRIFDQHALHERKLFDELLDRFSRSDGEDQLLLIPFTADLSPEDRELVLHHAPALARLGLRLEEFGPRGIVLRSVPMPLRNASPEQVLYPLIEVLRDSGRADATEVIRDVAAHVACKAAVKFGDALPEAEVRALLAYESLHPEARNCPHGRNTSLLLSLRELETRFQRKK